MLSLAGRKRIEQLTCALPKPVRDATIDAINPMRVAAVKRNHTLKWATFFITNYCNARCDHCFYWHELNSKVPELSVEQMATAFGSLNGQLNTLRLSGGEPFLRKDLPDFYKAIDRGRMAKKLQIPTHGMLKQLLPMVEAMLDGNQFTHLNIGISLDGLQARHDAFRKIRNGFDLAVANMREMVKFEDQNPRFNLSATLSLARGLVYPEAGEATSEMVRLIEFLRDDIGVKTIGYDHIRSADTDVFMLPAEINNGFAPPPKVDEDPNNRHKRSGDVQLDIDEMEQINTQLKQYESGDAGRLTMRRLEIQADVKKSRKRLVDCLAGYIDCVIYPTGDVAACEFTKPFANLKDFDYSLQALMDSPAADEARRLTRGCACTHPCHLSDSLAYDADFLKYYFDKPVAWE